MYSLQEMKENYSIIEKFSKNFRKELTVYQGIMTEALGMASVDSYTLFMNEFTDSEYAAVMTTGLLTEAPKNEFSKMIEGTLEFREYISDFLSDDQLAIWDRKMAE